MNLAGIFAVVIGCFIGFGLCWINIGGTPPGRIGSRVSLADMVAEYERPTGGEVLAVLELARDLAKQVGNSHSDDAGEQESGGGVEVTGAGILLLRISADLCEASEICKAYLWEGMPESCYGAASGRWRVLSSLGVLTEYDVTEQGAACLELGYLPIALEPDGDLWALSSQDEAVYCLTSLVSSQGVFVDGHECIALTHENVSRNASESFASLQAFFEAMLMASGK